MRDIWFTSDNHWHQKNILNFTLKSGEKLRPEFSSVEEMDEFMVDQWNSVVKNGDYVYNLGDITVNTDQFIKTTLERLNGKIRMVFGNHDKNMRLLLNHRKVEKGMIIRRFDEYGFACSHIPIHKSSLYNHRQDMYLVNVHGHIHKHEVGEKGYVNICVEKTNYKPIHLDELLVLVKENKF